MRHAGRARARVRHPGQPLPPGLSPPTVHEQRDALREHFAGMPLRVNLIDVNDARPDGFRRASEEELNDFRDRLRSLGIPVVRRYSGGAARHAACGMLASIRAGTPPLIS